MDTCTSSRLGIRCVQGLPRDPGSGRAHAARAAALGKFVNSRHDALVRFFTLRTGSREEAKDLVQCAYVKVLTVDRPERIRDLEGYVWRSALNLVTDWSRRRAVRENYARGAVSDSAGLTHSIDTELETRENIELVVRAHETLSARCREAFALRVLEDRPFKDVGRAMGISDRMAKIYVARARALLREAIDRAEQCTGYAPPPPTLPGAGSRASPSGREGRRVPIPYGYSHWS